MKKKQILASATLVLASGVLFWQMKVAESSLAEPLSSPKTPHFHAAAPSPKTQPLASRAVKRTTATPVSKTEFVIARPIELSSGVAVPSVFLPPPPGLLPGAVAIRQRLAESFLTEMEAASRQPEIQDDAKFSEAYDRAKKRADSEYRILFGEAAANREQLQATLDAAP